MVILDRCPLCSSRKISFYLRCTDHLVSKEEFDIYGCTGCGFKFTQAHPDEQHIGTYYESEDYISHDDSAEGFLNRIYLSVRYLMLRWKRNIVENATGGLKGSLLDIGSGTGYFAGIMKESGWHVTGIEPGRKAREFGITRFGIDVIEPGRISDLPDRSFDVITFWHVLEHLHDPFKYSAETDRLLKPGGICITALPNCSSSDALYYRNTWAAYDVPRHLWHFNADTIKLFWEKKGFKINSIRRLPADVFYISILSEKNLGSRMPVLKGIIKGIWFTVIAAVNMYKSSSLIFVQKRHDS